jgi:hypothetical protein
MMIASPIPYMVDAGGPWVLTTRQQGDRLKRIFPHLRILAEGCVSGEPAESPAEPAPLAEGSR